MSLSGVGEIATLASTVIGRLWPDKTVQERDQMAQAMALLQGQLDNDKAQLGVDQTEAASSSLFVSGWRPAVGWLCVLACGWNWLGLPILTAGLVAAGRHLDVKPANLSEMWPVLMGMLGLGGLRTYEKINGVASK